MAVHARKHQDCCTFLSRQLFSSVRELRLGLNWASSGARTPVPRAERICKQVFELRGLSLFQTTSLRFSTSEPVFRRHWKTSNRFWFTSAGHLSFAATNISKQINPRHLWLQLFLLMITFCFNVKFSANRFYLSDWLFTLRVFSRNGSSLHTMRLLPTVCPNLRTHARTEWKTKSDNLFSCCFLLCTIFANLLQSALIVHITDNHRETRILHLRKLHTCSLFLYIRTFCDIFQHSRSWNTKFLTLKRDEKRHDDPLRTFNFQIVKTNWSRMFSKLDKILLAPIVEIAHTNLLIMPNANLIFPQFPEFQIRDWRVNI